MFTSTTYKRFVLPLTGPSTRRPITSLTAAENQLFSDWECNDLRPKDDYKVASNDFSVIEVH